MEEGVALDFLAAVAEAEASVAKRTNNALDIPGLTLQCDFLTVQEEATLLRHVDAQPWNTALARRTQHYGHAYNYKKKQTEVASAVAVPPIPEWMHFIWTRLRLFGLVPPPSLREGAIFDQCIVNEYLPGQGIAAHVDSPHAFGPTIISVSLGSAVDMDFVYGIHVRSLSLPGRSAIVLTKEARYEWTHAIARRHVDHGVARGRRVSLTFRWVNK
jgi:alkylated DNA repair dioxygenase AlkB